MIQRRPNLAKCPRPEGRGLLASVVRGVTLAGASLAPVDGIAYEPGYGQNPERRGDDRRSDDRILHRSIPSVDPRDGPGGGTGEGDRPPPRLAMIGALGLDLADHVRGEDDPEPLALACDGKSAVPGHDPEPELRRLPVVVPDHVHGASPPFRTPGPVPPGTRGTVPPQPQGNLKECSG